MKTIFFSILLFVFLIALSNVGVMIERSNGIPDLFSKYLPQYFLDEEKVAQDKAAEQGMAPFAAGEQAAATDDYTPPVAYEPLAADLVVSENLKVPHRNEFYVNEWVTEAVSKVMTFKYGDYDAHRTSLAEHYMDASGLNEFEAFLQGANVLGLMQKGYEMRGFVTDLPRRITSGVVANRYRWAYDVPMSLTFFPEGAADYDHLEPGQYITEDLVFTIQIGRVAQGGTEGIVIESWSVRKKKGKAG